MNLGAISRQLVRSMLLRDEEPTAARSTDHLPGIHRPVLRNRLVGDLSNQPELVLRIKGSV